MKERPILFQGAMVRALLAGTKTQTRRAIRVQPWASCCIEEGMEGETPFVYSALGGDGPGHDVHETRSPCRCPYGQPGDRLWVRETWGVGTRPDPHEGWYDGIEYRADEAYLEEDEYLHLYRVKVPEGKDLDDYRGGWKPSIHMPRWACRIVLEVTEVRVERLQAISEADAKAEGISEFIGGWWCEHDGAPQIAGMTPQEGYRHLWECINGAGSWAANPWVWAVTFKPIAA